MKTLQDCLDKVAKAHYPLYLPNIVHFNEAAELYGRYMRLVGRAKVKKEMAMQIGCLREIGSNEYIPTPVNWPDSRNANIDAFLAKREARKNKTP